MLSILLVENAKVVKAIDKNTGGLQALDKHLITQSCIKYSTPYHVCVLGGGVGGGGVSNLIVARCWLHI